MAASVFAAIARADGRLGKKAVSTFFSLSFMAPGQTIYVGLSKEDSKKLNAWAGSRAILAARRQDVRFWLTETPLRGFRFSGSPDLLRPGVRRRDLPRVQLEIWRRFLFGCRLFRHCPCRPRM